MLVPLEWLNEYVKVDCGAEELARRMTFSGTKAESVTFLGEEFENVVAGRLLTVEKHPNADKLQVSQVDVGRGDGASLQIITGATNVRAGDVVPIALDKSRLPGGVRIKAAKMRGVESQGMMCSIQELNLSKHDYPDAADDGIFILDPSVVPGTDIREIFGLDDAVIDFEITPNRPDCLGMLGIAREAAATIKKPLTLPPALTQGRKSEDARNEAQGGAPDIAELLSVEVRNEAQDGAPDIAELLSVEVRDAALCKRYTARVVTDAVIKPSPEWMKRRLRNAGVRPINNIVDITNYVMLEMGQPMHAFDARFVGGGKIIVRRAGDGEVIRTLDGGDRALDASVLVIADSEKPIAVAGVMGGENSEILPDTRTIIFESANFEGVSVRRAAKKLGMRTESSSRYEKGLDPDMTRAAADRAVELAELLAAGSAARGCIDVYPAPLPPARVRFSPERINALLGTSLDREVMLDILRTLEFSYDEAHNEIIVPPFRMDVGMEADLAEEVARFYDYNNIKATLNPGSAVTIGLRTYRQQLKKHVLDTVVACGFSEIYTFSFQSPKVYDRLRLPQDDPLRCAVRIGNPMNEDMSLMRTTALPEMLKALADNHAQRTPAAELFELAATYHPADGAGNAPTRPDGSAAARSGGPAAASPVSAAAAPVSEVAASAADVAAADALLPVQRTSLTIGAYGAPNDFYTLKGVFEDLFFALGIRDYEFLPCRDAAIYHPGRAACIKIGGKDAGAFGELHPDVAEEFGTPERTYAGCLSLEAVYEAADLSRSYTRLPKFPPVPRDLALLVDGGVTSGELIRVMKKAAGSLLETIDIFDVYTGKQVPEGKKSMAYSLLFRAEDRTLTDEEVGALVAKIVAALAAAGAELRT
ncbi:MAG: phenylalanine--tRNA ligase subunit beta [Clostridiales bacterium]|jgi:phenylalanyl-tRNA synthetase beta chain|nr:phenylalanine--tRNA ligase subunit beta [Clostridiales bacterium]